MSASLDQTVRVWDISGEGLGMVDKRTVGWVWGRGRSGGQSGTEAKEEVGAGRISSPGPVLLPLLLVEDKSLWAVCRNTSPFRTGRGEEIVRDR